jgi:transcriptional regulator with XRE-family HTH domain
MLEEMPLQEPRQARQLSRAELASILGAKQATISKMERTTDMYVSTLRAFIGAMGGQLDILARFPDGVVRINQFGQIEPAVKSSPPRRRRAAAG